MATENINFEEYVSKSQSEQAFPALSFNLSDLELKIIDLISIQA